MNDHNVAEKRLCLQYHAATSSKKLACTRMQAAATCAHNYTHMHVHSVQCNVNLATTWEGLQLTLKSAVECSACEYSCVYFELVAAQYCTSEK